LAVKKSLAHPKADAQKRAEFSLKIKAYEEEGKPIVYIDESGFAHGHTRSHGYSEVGKRCHGIFHWGLKGRTNAIGALIKGALLTVALFPCNINADVFYAWAAQDLVPKLPVGSIVVMDNAAFHKREDIKRRIEKAGHTLEFLPPYSPDLNPIEHKWAQLKSIRNQLRCSVDDLFTEAVVGHLFISD